MTKRERKGLIVFMIVCLILPFAMIRHLVEATTLALPLFVYCYGTPALWFYHGKASWEIFLAAYGASSFCLICIYLGTGMVQVILKKICKKKAAELPKFISEKRKRGNKVINKIINNLSKKAVWIILFVFFVPVPLSDSTAIIAMKLKGVKKGLWMLLALNIGHIALIVWLTSLLF